MRSSIMISRAFCIVLALSASSGCGRIVSTSHVEHAAAVQKEGDDPLRDADEWISRGGCDRGDEILQSIQTRGPEWYEVASQVHMCRWRKDSKDAEKAAAISVLDEGLRAFPKNANLILSKAYRYQEVGDRTQGAEFFREAQLTAESQANSDPASANRVIEAAVRGQHELQGTTATPPAAATQRGAELVNEGRCADAATVLDAVAKTDRLHDWYVARLSAADCCWMAKSAQAERCRADAEETLTAGLQRFPNSIELLARGAFFEERNGNRNRAIDFFTRAKALCSEDPSKCQEPFSPADIENHLASLRSAR